MVPVILALALPVTSVAQFTVLPQDTDPKITTYLSPHVVTEHGGGSPRGELLLFLPGTNGTPGNTDRFGEVAASVGYQVISLMYPDDISATVTRKSKDPNSFLNFRVEIIEGKDLSTAVKVDRASSIENRLIKLLGFLHKKSPTSKWDRYLTKSGGLEWSRIAVSGLSQGAGHAALIATRHRTARAILFGGPKDYDRTTNKPAAWFKKPVTPGNLIFAFNHEKDAQGCNFKEQLEICRTMGLEKFGAPVSVDSVASPYKNSRVLTTNYPVMPMNSIRAHTSVVADPSTPKTETDNSLFEPVWKYMLTAK